MNGACSIGSAARFKETRDLIEKDAVVWKTHMFKHADRDDTVEMAPDIAVISKLECDFMSDASFLRALYCDRELLFRQSYAQD